MDVANPAYTETQNLSAKEVHDVNNMDATKETIWSTFAQEDKTFYNPVSCINHDPIQEKVLILQI